MKTKGDLVQALDLTRRSVELAPSDPDCLLFYSVTLFDSGHLQIATEMMDKASELHPLPPSYYHFFHAMILWGNKRFKEALDEADQCLRKAPKFGGAEVYRTLALVGLGRIAEAKAQIKEYVSRSAPPPTPPRPPELASRFLAHLKAAGPPPTLRPSVQRVRQPFYNAFQIFSDFIQDRQAPGALWCVFQDAPIPPMEGTGGKLKTSIDHVWHFPLLREGPLGA